MTTLPLNLLWISAELAIVVHVLPQLVQLPQALLAIVMLAGTLTAHAFTSLTGSRAAYEELQTRERLLTVLLDSCPASMGVVRIVDSREIVGCYVNEATRIINQWEGQPQVIGCFTEKGLSREYLDLWLVKYLEALKTQKTVTFEIHHPWRPMVFHILAFPLKSKTVDTSNLVAYLSFDITRDKIHYRTVRASEKRLISAIEGADNGIIDWNPRSNRMWVSNQWFEQLRVPMEKRKVLFDGGAVDYFMDLADSVSKEKLVASIYDHVAGNSRVYEEDVKLTREDGTDVWLHCCGSVVERDAEGLPTRLIGMNSDITKQKKLQLDLEQALNTANEATRAKSEFLANCSHELRSPLNGIIGMSSLLATDKNLTPYQQDLVESMEACSKHLLQVISDVLDFSKIEAGKVELELRPIHLSDCVREAISVLRIAANDKSLYLECDIAPDVPAEIVTDLSRLRQVLVNLIGNGIKFTPSGGVTLRVSVRAERIFSDFQGEACDPRDSFVLLFEVADTGIGIPAGRTEKLFKSFSQVDASITRKFGGTGLGLAICRSLVTLMEGDIWCEPNSPKGTVFKFTLLTRRPSLNSSPSQTPRSAPSSPLRPPSSSPFYPSCLPTPGEDVAVLDLPLPALNHKLEPVLSEPSEAFSVEDCPRTTSGLPQRTKKSRPVPRLAAFYPLSILLVEDNPINRKVAILYLKKMGYNQIEVAVNGLEAVEAFKRKHFDLCMMDVQMPVMSGLRATQLIRQHEQSLQLARPCVIIALTANVAESNHQLCLESGLDDFLTKPILITVLADTIIQHCSPSGGPVSESPPVESQFSELGCPEFSPSEETPVTLPLPSVASTALQNPDVATPVGLGANLGVGSNLPVPPGSTALPAVRLDLASGESSLQNGSSCQGPSTPRPPSSFRSNLSAASPQSYPPVLEKYGFSGIKTALSLPQNYGFWGGSLCPTISSSAPRPSDQSPDSSASTQSDKSDGDQALTTQDGVKRSTRGQFEKQTCLAAELPISGHVRRLSSSVRPGRSASPSQPAVKPLIDVGLEAFGASHQLLDLEGGLSEDWMEWEKPSESPRGLFVETPFVSRP